LTSYSYGEWQNWGISSENSQPIVTKFGLGDYVSDMTQCAKVQTDRPSMGIPATGVKYHSHIVFSFFVGDPNISSHPKTKTENGFL